MNVPFLLLAILAYAVLGSVAAYLIMSRRGVPMNLFWIGTPGYLYKICRNSEVDPGGPAKFLALTSSLAFLVGFPWAVVVSSVITYP